MGDGWVGECLMDAWVMGKWVGRYMDWTDRHKDKSEGLERNIYLAAWIFYISISLQLLLWVPDSTNT